MTKLFIASPMYGGQNYGYFNQSMLQLQALMGQNNINTAVSYLFNESLIQRARNALAHGFMRTDFTHMMFIDSDIRFNPQDILRMIHADKPIICGIYPKKEINWEQVRKAAIAGVPTEKLRLYSGSFVVNLVGYAGQVQVNLYEPVEIWNGGTGFMLIKREVLTGLIGKVPYYLNNVLDLANPANGETIHEFFATQIEEDTKILLSEDYDFCKKARNNGFTVWAAPWVELSHIGTYAFEGRLLKQP